jgi:hypothetical protein
MADETFCCLPPLLQAPGVPSGSGREVLLAWLAAVAAANEPRLKGGEYSALKYLQGGPLLKHQL